MYYKHLFFRDYNSAIEKGVSSRHWDSRPNSSMFSIAKTHIWAWKTNGLWSFNKLSKAVTMVDVIRHHTS